MSKQYDEMATEITVAWINAVGPAVNSGRLAPEWLEAKAIQEIFRAAYKVVNEPLKKD